MLLAQITACAIAVAFNFDQLPMTYTIERQKHKHISWKFEDVGLKRQFYKRLDNMLDAASGGLLRVNRGTDTNRLADLLTFKSNAILKSGKEIFGMRKPSKFNLPGWNEKAKELNARYMEAVRHWNIAELLRSGHLLSKNVGHELPSGMNEIFERESGSISFSVNAIKTSKRRMQRFMEEN